MDKRTFIGILVGGAFSTMLGCTKIKIFAKKVKGRLSPKKDATVSVNKMPVSFAEGAENVSIETALNSRCTSDSDGDQYLSHWGLFNPSGKIPSERLQELKDLVIVPRFSNGKLGLRLSGNSISFDVDDTVQGTPREIMMIESGMQQQALALACAALGYGNRIQNRGIDGSSGQNGTLTTVTINVDAMSPSYNGSFWSSEAPAGDASWVRGNLPEPDRKGSVALLSSLKKTVITKEGPDVSINILGQILWACRGRTPHYYNAKPWGMTMPTWSGNPFSSATIVTSSKTYSYTNSKKGRPTHSLTVHNGEQVNVSILQKIFPDRNCFIVLSKNESSGRALWEIGYQIENMVIQACSLDFGYELKILPDDQRNIFHPLSKTGEPVAVMALNMVNDILLTD